MASFLIPLAISSQLDVTGEERIHAATYDPVGEVGHVVYELEKGWSFDSYYIPHFVELNWYFGDNPVDYRNTQKVRIHGLTKGRTFLEASTNGMQTDYISDYSTPQYIDLPAHPTYVTQEFLPITNWCEANNRGLSVQFKFEGRNTDITLPEPAHVLQVLVVQSTADGTGARSN